MPKEEKKKKDVSEKVQKTRRAVDKLKEEIRANRESMKDTTRLFSQLFPLSPHPSLSLSCVFLSLTLCAYA